MEMVRISISYFHFYKVYEWLVRECYFTYFITG